MLQQISTAITRRSLDVTARIRLLLYILKHIAATIIIIVAVVDDDDDDAVVTNIN